MYIFKSDIKNSLNNWSFRSYNYYFIILIKISGRIPAGSLNTNESPCPRSPAIA
jgi:hypothetical protein